LTWQAVDGAFGYAITVDGDDPLNVGMTLQYDVTGLTAATEYSFEVAAYTATGELGEWAGPVTATTNA